MEISSVDSIHVLHVDDDSDFADLAATYLERQSEQLTVETATSASEGLERLTEGGIDCVVSDYDMPGMNGIEFLETVREEYSNIPFILFTGKGSEEVASEAIACGVTDYLQKSPGSEQYELLANRITNAVSQYRSAERAANLDRIRNLLRDVNQTLVRATTREEIEQRVCEIISDADPYSFAWIGDAPRETDRIEPRASAGIEKGYLDDITVTLDESPTGRGPAGTALREERIAVSQNVDEDPAFAPWRDEATERGYRAVAGVPLVHEKRRYGVLSVYADRTAAFDEQERDLLREVGNDIAHAIHRVELRTQLQQRETHLEQAQNVANIGSWHRDFETGALYWSDEVYNIFGASGDITPSHDVFLDRVHPDDRAFVEDRWEAAQGGEPYDLEHRIVVDGETKWVREKARFEYDADGTPREALGIVQDITARKRRERELEETTAKLKAFGQAFPDVAFLTDEEGAYLEVFTRSQTESLLYFGDSDAYTEEQTIRDVFADDADRALAAIQEALETGEIQTLEYQLDVQSGQRWFEARIAPVENQPEKRERVVWVARDVTERRERAREDV